MFFVHCHCTRFRDSFCLASVFEMTVYLLTYLLRLMIPVPILHFFCVCVHAVVVRYPNRVRRPDHPAISCLRHTRPHVYLYGDFRSSGTSLLLLTLLGSEWYLSAHCRTEFLRASSSGTVLSDLRRSLLSPAVSTVFGCLPHKRLRSSYRSVSAMALGSG